MINSDLLSMTVPASGLGWEKNQWPDTFQRGGRTYTKGNATISSTGEVQCVTYVDNLGKWLVVFNE